MDSIMKTVAIQGIAGSFHHEAAELFFDAKIKLIECQSFSAVFKAVEGSKADYGIVAIENSLHGSINAVYRLLANQNLWVCGEVRLKIEQYLIAAQPIAEVDFSIIDKVYSQAPALAQCENWLDAHIAGDLVETHDTAESVRHIVHYKDQPLAAVAGKKAATLYKGTIVAGPINDDPDNYTRFFIISRQPTITPSADRTSIILTEKSPDSAGSLYSALGYFKEANINLSKLDSHPLPGKKRQYSFYIDFDQSSETPTSKHIIAQLNNDGWEVKLLGSYLQWHN
jgi:prephenate dehydratase